MSRRTNYQIRLTETRIAKFSNPDDAQRFAQAYAQTGQHFVEVYDMSKRGGIIGQYDRNGMPTPEFQGRGDEIYPAGPRP